MQYFTARLVQKLKYTFFDLLLTVDPSSAFLSMLKSYWRLRESLLPKYGTEVRPREVRCDDQNRGHEKRNCNLIQAGPLYSKHFKTEIKAIVTEEEEILQTTGHNACCKSSTTP